MDDLALVGSWAATIALAICLAAAAGLRAWLPLFVAGLLARLGIADLGEGFGWLSSSPALACFGIATALEIIGDKVPALDHALDTVGTVLRPAAGALAAAAVLVHIRDPMVAVVLGMIVGVPSALVPHAAKASARAVSSATTVGFANPVLSAIEDGAALALVTLAFVVPVLMLLALIAAGIVFARWVARRRQRSGGQARA